MITLKRKCTLNWKLNPTAFEVINEKSLVSLFRKLGTAIKPVNTMISCAEEMELLLPEILGVSPNSSTSNWQARLENYWHNFYLDVPKSGKDFDNSMTFSINDNKRKSNIDSLIKELGLKLSGKELEKALFKHITENVKEEDKYKYMHPSDVESYLAWRYCLISNEVANIPEDMDKSNKIRFYIVDDNTIKAKKDKESALRKSAILKYTTLISKEDAESVIENLLISSDSVLSLKSLKELESSDREAILMNMATDNPAKFNSLIDDKLSADKAEIKKWVMAGLIRQLSNTSIYVDASDPKIVLGNTLENCIAYINSDVNAEYVNQLRLKFKNL